MRLLIPAHKSSYYRSRNKRGSSPPGERDPMAVTGKRDFTQGVAFSEVLDGHSVSGTVGEDEVILVRRGDNLFAVGAYCTHYHGALADGLVVGDTVRCPLHHACFDLRTGKALRAPALDPITCWRVERIGETAFVREKLTPPA